MAVTVARVALALTAGACTAEIARRWLRYELGRLPEPGDVPTPWLDRLSQRRATIVMCAAVALFAVVLGLHFRPAIATAAYLYIGAMAAPLATVDLAVHRLPRRLVWSSCLIVGALLGLDAALSHEAPVLGRAALAGLLVGVLFWLLALMTGGIGAGDVRLVGVLALALGYRGWTHVIAGLLLAFLLATGDVIAGRISQRRPRDERVALGPHLLLGALITLTL